ncbi:MAG: RsmE family RNA methyltransferase [Bdellovibrionales bacterium]
MRRYWIESSQIENDQVVFSGEQLHHLRDVCRLQPGSKFEVLFEGSQAHFVEMIEVGKKQASARILETRQIPSLPKPLIHLAISLPKFQKFETVIEKAVELGVSRILPFVSDFSFIRDLNKVSESKKQRWQKIVVGATQQTGRGDLLQVADPIRWSQLFDQINRVDRNECLFLYEGSGQLNLKQAFEQIQPREVESIWLIIGSEGGFSDREVEQMVNGGLRPVTLGDQVLRVETACIAAASMAHFHFRL